MILNLASQAVPALSIKTIIYNSLILRAIELLQDNHLNLQKRANYFIILGY